MSFDGFLKRSLYWTKDFFAGRKVRKHFLEIRKVLKNGKDGKEIQKKKLEELLVHATSFSEFYKQYKGKSLTEFPVVNKSILIENKDIVAVPFQHIPEQETQEIHIQKTSGSTGTPFSVLQDSRKRHRRVAELKYWGESVGFKSHEKLAQCRIWTKWQSKSKKQAFWENIFPINVSKMDDNTLAVLCETIRKNKIVSIRAYASWYDKLVEYFENGKGNPKDLKSVKVAISSSEALNEETRRKMLELTGVHIVECYADEEGGVLAQQKLNDSNYYLNHASYFFEFLKLDSDQPAEYGELARIVFTDLYNYAFPLIRYDTGDTGVLEKNSESDQWDYMSKLYGRKLDLVYNEKGEPIHPMNFARILKNIEGIRQWQFIQKSQKEYVVKLKADERLDEKYITKEIKAIVGENTVLTLEMVDEIPVLASGKRKSVICEWKKEN